MNMEFFMQHLQFLMLIKSTLKKQKNFKHVFLKKSFLLTIFKITVLKKRLPRNSFQRVSYYTCNLITNLINKLLKIGTLNAMF